MKTISLNHEKKNLPSLCLRHYMHICLPESEIKHIPINYSSSKAGYWLKRDTVI